VKDLERACLGNAESKGKMHNVVALGVDVVHLLSVLAEDCGDFLRDQG
jgi:hypothetical protein